MIISINSVVLSDEPKGLKDAAFKIVRDQNIQGQFISDLEFWGDGYSVLLNIASNNPPCTEIAVDIDNECGFTFEGRILVKDIDFNEKTCTAVAAIEDNSAQSRIERLSSVAARFGQTKSINGDTISAYSGELISVSGRTPNQIRGFKIKDSISYLARYLTNGDAVCNFFGIFNTDYNYVRYEIDCTLILVTNPSTVDFQWIDIYGQQQTVQVPILSPANDNAYAAQIGTGFNALQPFGNGMGPFYVERPVSTPYTGNTLVFHFWNADAQFSLVSTNGTGLIEGSAGPLTFTPTQVGAYGIQNVFFTNGAFLNDVATTADQFTLSWEQLQAFLVTYNISAEYIGNNINFYEQRDTFESAVSATINDIEEVKISYSEPLSISAMSFRQPFQSPKVTDIFALSQSIGYGGADCSEDEVRIGAEFNYAITDDFSATASVGNFDTEQMYVFEAISGALARYEIREGTTLLSLSHFATGMHPFAAHQQVFKNPNGLTFENNVILNVEAIKLRKLCVFEHPLTTNQIIAIKANPKRRIVFDGRFGYIAELEYNTKTGMTSFNLLTE